VIRLTAASVNRDGESANNPQQSYFPTAVTDAIIECLEARCSLRSSPKDEAVKRRRGN